MDISSKLAFYALGILGFLTISTSVGQANQHNDLNTYYSSSYAQERTMSVDAKSIKVAAVDRKRYCLALVDLNYASCRKGCNNAFTSPCMKNCVARKKYRTNACLGKPNPVDDGKKKKKNKPAKH